MRFSIWTILGFLSSLALAADKAPSPAPTANSVTAQEMLVMTPELWAKKKEGACVFVHAWAMWCTYCVQEMPQVFEALHSLGNIIDPVVIDMSLPEVQVQLSKPWLATLHPPFPLYFRPPGDEHAFQHKLEPSFPHLLPYSFLLQKGKKTAGWRGQLNLPALKKELQEKCGSGT